MSAPATALIVAGLAFGGVAGAYFAGFRHAPAQASAPAPERQRLVVPRTQGDVVIDGETTDSAWTAGPIARTGAFSARPYSDGRLVWKGDTLYMILYAADEDLRATDARHDDPLWLADSYRVSFWRDGQESVIEVSPAGVLTDMRRDHDGAFDTSWESGAKIALDRDGTLNDAHDNDEEWVVEMALPLKSIGLEGRPGEHIDMSITRCDLSRGSDKRECATWGRNSVASRSPTGEIVLGE